MIPLSIFHAIFNTVLSFIALYSGDILIANIAITIFTIYIAADIVLLFIYGDIAFKSLLVHHCIGLLLPILYVLENDNNKLVLIYFIFLEITTPFLHVRVYLNFTSLLYKIDGILLLILWIIFRIIGMLYYPIKKYSITKLSIIGIPLYISAFILNIYWGLFIIKSFYSYFMSNIRRQY
jgi:hypothetical protein